MSVSEFERFIRFRQITLFFLLIQIGIPSIINEEQTSLTMNDNDDYSFMFEGENRFVNLTFSNSHFEEYSRDYQKIKIII
jgi:hypothetical protein